LEIEILSKELQHDEVTFSPMIMVTARVPLELQFLELQSEDNKAALDELYLKVGKEFFEQLRK